MNSRNDRYMKDVDELIESTPLNAVLEHYGREPSQRASGEHRMQCPFNADCREKRYGNLTINLDSRAKLIYAHCCEVRGNLLTLIHGLETGRPPSTPKLRGEEFKAAVLKLREIAGIPTGAEQRPKRNDQVVYETKQVTVVNVPLKDSDNERARTLENLDDDLIVDLGAMAPAAAGYFRSRPWLTPEVARKWRMGYLPQSAKGLLRGRIVYGYLDTKGDVLSWFGRDPGFECKEAEWIERGHPEKGKPIKTRFVKGFHRGLELFGQQASRLKEPHVRESLLKQGLVIVEGPNDVMRLDCLGIAALALCSNRATNEQVGKIMEFAKFAEGRVTLMPDLDDEGEAGFKELLWKLSEAGIVQPRLAWSRSAFNGEFAGRQPETLLAAECELLFTK